MACIISELDQRIVIDNLNIIGPGQVQEGSRGTLSSRYNTKQRIGKGFTLEELKVGIVLV